jgi:phosphomevalonate decarboxylase
MYKSSAIAYPIQGLIKYHGLKDEKLRIPFNDSISVCVAPFRTHTTIEFSKQYQQDKVEIDGKVVAGREHERVLDVVNRIREAAKISLSFQMKSVNNFPSNIGLGASSSGFAALAKSAADALNLKLSLKELSRIARIGAGSASRAVTGGFSYWAGGDSDETSFSYSLANSGDVPLGIIVVFIEAYKQTEDAHKEVITSPFHLPRIEYVENALKQMVQAIQNKDIERIGWLAEYDTLNLHAVTMTGENASIHWRPETVRLMLEIRKMRNEGLPVFFSIDTGATVYVNTYQNLSDEIDNRLHSLGFRTQIGCVGGSVQTINEHLF